MDPLKRNNPGVLSTNHEDRIQALERRIIPGPPSLAFLRRTTDASVNPGSALIEWERFATTDRDVFATSVSGVYPAENNSPNDTLLLVKEEGLVVVNLVVQWETGTYVRSAVIASTSSEPALSDLGSPAMTHAFDQATYCTYLGTNYPFGTVPEQINFTTSQSDAVARDLTFAAAICEFWPADALTTTVYG